MRIIVSNKPKISMKTIQHKYYDTRIMYYTIDLDMYTTNYNINEDGINIINDYIEKNIKLYMYSKQKNNNYRYRHQTVNHTVVRIVIVNSEQVAREFANFLLETVSNKKYISKMCDNWSDMEKEFFNEVWQEFKAITHDT